MDSTTQGLKKKDTSTIDDGTASINILHNSEDFKQINSFLDNKCGVCDQMFYFQQNFDDHVQNFHLNGTAYKCRFCTERFAHILFLSDHVIKIHKYKTIDKKSKRRVNSNEYTHTCNTCKKSFKTVGRFKNHQKIHSADIVNAPPRDLNSNQSEEISIKNEICSDIESLDDFEIENLLEISKTEFKVDETIINAEMKPSHSQQKSIFIIDDGVNNINIEKIKDIKEEFLLDNECVDKMEFKKDVPVTKNINSEDNKMEFKKDVPITKDINSEDNSRTNDFLQSVIEAVDNNTTESLFLDKMGFKKDLPATKVINSEENSRTDDFLRSIIEAVDNNTTENLFVDKMVFKEDLPITVDIDSEDSCSTKNFLQSNIEDVDDNTTESLTESKLEYKVHICKFCSQTFNCKFNWRAHLREHTGNRPYSCSFCKKTFSKVGFLNNHQRRHTDERPFSCTCCKETFRFKSQLKFHEMRHCKKFKHRKSLKDHHDHHEKGTQKKSRNRRPRKVINDSNLQSLPCLPNDDNQPDYNSKNKDTKQFELVLNSTKDSQKSQTEIDRPNSTKDWQKSETDGPNNTKNSRKSITEADRPNPKWPRKSYVHICEFCSKSFTRKHGLKRHLRIHNGERLHSCSFCERTFTEMDTLKQHVRIHTGERPLACTFCDVSFSHRANLAAHLKIHTNGEKHPFSCSVCKRTFKLRRHLSLHNRTHEKEKKTEEKECEN